MCFLDINFKKIMKYKLFVFETGVNTMNNIFILPITFHLDKTEIIILVRKKAA